MSALQPTDPPQGAGGSCRLLPAGCFRRAAAGTGLEIDLNRLGLGRLMKTRVAWRPFRGLAGEGVFSCGP